jgi:superfamily II DNA or RNA helicase
LILILTPGGRLRLIAVDDDAGTCLDSWMKRVVAGFAACPAAGLFALAAARPETPPSPVLAFWREFGARYLTQLCRTPDFIEKHIEAIEPPDESELADLLLTAPPMQGGEYLGAEVLRSLWNALDAWTRNQVATSADGLAGWLKQHAPLWQQVGRVCFHLAENKRDPELPFAFLATYAPKLSKGGGVQYQPLGKALQEYAGARNKRALINLLAPVQRASEKVAIVRALVETGDIFHPLAWTPDEAYRLLKSLPLLEECGLLVRLPDWWRKRARPQISVTIGQKRASRIGAETMLDFKVGLALGDEQLSEKEWRQIMAATDGLAFVKGRWIEVDRQRLSEALEHWRRVEARAAGEGISFIEGMRLLAGAPGDLSADSTPDGRQREWAYVGAGKWLAEVLAGLRDPQGLDTGRPIKGFQGTLRPYQQVGCNWLRFLSGLGLGACLADDMGLGKTVQVLALLLELKENKRATKPSLLVLPASLLSNWKAEIQRFAPSLWPLFIHPSETDKSALDTAARDPEAALANADLVLTTYGMLLRHKWLREVHWQLVILDEAQAIKNPSARQSRVVKQLKADARIALTGTPVENRLSDLWSLFDFLCPGLLGSPARFKGFVKALEERARDRYAPLRNLVRPYVLRRLKTDKRIIADLPDKTEMKAFCGLTRQQAALYAKTVEEMAAALQGLDGMHRRGLVLAYLMRFKQICNHPSQFLGDGRYEPGDSGKFDRLMAICEEIGARQEKVLVFTQFREMTDPIAAFLSEVFGRQGLVLHGGTAVKKRRHLIDLFQKEEGPPFFVLSLKAGGTGLNLTAASHVIHFDRWWNPAVENQATDRAFRIGQHRNVVVHKFVCRGTVEEKIDTLITEKSSLADDILKAGAEALLTEMSDEQLMKIVTLDLDRAQLSGDR